MSRNFLGYLIFSFISPVVSLITGLLSGMSPKYKQRLLTVFITLYGSVIMFNNGQDGIRHWNAVYDHYVGLPFIQFMDEAIQLAQFKVVEGINDDLYIHVLSYFTGGILGLPQLFFVFVAFIYAYFYSKSLFKVLTFSKNDKYGFLFWGFVWLFVLWKSIEGINTVRSWTGTWVLFYGCISYYQTKKWKYLLLMFVPVQIHIGFAALAIPAWIVLFAGLRKRLYVILLGVSLFATQFNLGSSFMDLVKSSEKAELKSSQYYIETEKSSAEILEANKGNQWYKKLERLGYFKTIVTILSFILIFFGIYQRYMNELESRLFSIGILSKALSYFLWFIYAVNSRASIIGGLFIFAALLLYLQRRTYIADLGRRYRFLNAALWINLLSFIPFFAFNLSYMLYLFSAFLLFFPFVPWFDYDINFTVRELLGFLIGK